MVRLHVALQHMSENMYTQLRKISVNGLFSYDVYKVKAGGIDQKHYHTCFEIAYVLKGNCKTHKQGHVYIYPKGKIHELINDSKNELFVACLTIPPETKKNTFYV